MNRINRITLSGFTGRLLLAATTSLILFGCRSELYDQEYGEPLEKSNFFADKRMSRQLVEGTVAQNHLVEDDALHTGRDAAGQLAAEFPMEVTREVMQRGRERYNIYCSPCHGYTGRGDGMIVKRGMKKPPSYLEARLVSSPPGYFVEVIKNGFGVMFSYASRVKPEDRWAIAAYIRALQHAGVEIPSDSTATTPQQASTDSTAGNSAAANDTTRSQNTRENDTH